MKASRIWTYILAIAPLVIVLILLGQIPDQIPAHYGADGLVDRWGSKYELLILPIASLLLGVLSDLMLWAKREPGAKVDRFQWVRTTVLILLCVFLALTIVFIAITWQQLERIYTLDLSALPNIYTLIGILMIVFGVVMPFIPKNPLFGARTSWAMESDENWKQAQKVGGITILITGVIILLASAFLHPNLTVVVVVIALVAMAAVNLIYSWQMAKASSEVDEDDYDDDYEDHEEGNPFYNDNDEIDEVEDDE